MGAQRGPSVRRDGRAAPPGWPPPPHRVQECRQQKASSQLNTREPSPNAVSANTKASPVPPRSCASTSQTLGPAFQTGTGARQRWGNRMRSLADGTAQLPPSLLAGRTAGPVFLASRLPTRAAPELDPGLGLRPRLASYRRAGLADRRARCRTLSPEHTGWRCTNPLGTNPCCRGRGQPCPVAFNSPVPC